MDERQYSWTNVRRTDTHGYLYDNYAGDYDYTEYAYNTPWGESWRY